MSEIENKSIKVKEHHKELSSYLTSLSATDVSTRLLLMGLVHAFAPIGKERLFELASKMVDANGNMSSDYMRLVNDRIFDDLNGTVIPSSGRKDAQDMCKRAFLDCIDKITPLLNEA